MDGVTDCSDSLDENTEYWKKCGSGQTVRYVEKSSVCEDVFLCDETDEIANFVTLKDLCDKIPSCGMEDKVCEKSKTLQKTWDFVIENNHLNRKHVSFSLEGMEDLKNHKSGCTLQAFELRISKVQTRI